jgi:hypothetical protein
MLKIKESNYIEFAKKEGKSIKPEEATKFRKTEDQIKEEGDRLKT